MLLEFLATNVTTTYKASYVDHAGNTYTIFAAACSGISYIRNKGISEAVFKSMKCFL